MLIPPSGRGYKQTNNDTQSKYFIQYEINLNFFIYVYEEEIREEKKIFAQKAFSCYDAINNKLLIESS